MEGTGEGSILASDGVREKLQRWGLAAFVLASVIAGAWQVMQLSWEQGRQSQQVQDNSVRSNANQTTISVIQGKLSDRRVRWAHTLQHIEDQQEQMGQELQYLVKISRQKEATRPRVPDPPH